MTLLDAVITLLRRTATSPDPRYVMEVNVEEAKALLKALGLKIDLGVPSQWRVVWHMDGDEDRGGSDFVNATDASDAREAFKRGFLDGNFGLRDSRAVVITSVTREG